MDERLLSWHYENEARTKESCKELLFRLKKLHLDPVLEKLQGRGEPKFLSRTYLTRTKKLKMTMESWQKALKMLSLQFSSSTSSKKTFSFVAVVCPFLRTYYYSYQQQHFFVFRLHFWTGILTSFSRHSCYMNKKERPVSTVWLDNSLSYNI